MGKGIGGSAKKEPRFIALDLLAALKPFLIAHGLDHTEHLDGVHIKDPF